MVNNKFPKFSFKKLKSSEKKELLNKISNFYNEDIEELKQYNFYINNKGKINISNINIDELDIDLVRLNAVGLYFGTMHDGDRFRPSFEGSRIIKPTKNMLKLNEKSINSYITGENLFLDEIEKVNTDDKCPFYIIEYESNFLGSVSIKDDFVINYISKGRKLDYNKMF